VGHPREPQTGLFHHPPEYRYPGPVTLDSSDPWDRFFAFCRDWLDNFPRDDGNFALVFLSGCAWYDPPHDDLIGFANHADNLLGGWHPMAEKHDPPPPGLPITWIPDLEDLMTDSAAEAGQSDQQFLLELKDALVATLTEMGLDGDAIWAAAESVTRRGTSFLKLGYNLPSAQPLVLGSTSWSTWAKSQPFIEVQPETTEADVRAAFQWIKRRLPTPAPSTKSTRDPLLCLQCAIWRDDLGWSEKQIGDQCGWTIQRSSIAKPRCETARQHIAEGRAMLAQRPDAA
jgi:hypothetical protein